MKKIVVTGGLGFIGSNLIKLLISKKYHVLNIDKVSYSSSFYNVKEFTNSKKYKFFKADLNDKRKILNILNKYKPHAVFNLAAETHVDRSIDGPETFIKNNILGIFNLLQTFRKHILKNKNCKLIHISTDEVYGDVLFGRSRENDPYKTKLPLCCFKSIIGSLSIFFY